MQIAMEFQLKTKGKKTYHIVRFVLDYHNASGFVLSISIYLYNLLALSFLDLFAYVQQHDLCINITLYDCYLHLY